MITQVKTKYETVYELPNGLSEETYCNMLYDLIDFAKNKGLTIRQAQCLFSDARDIILEQKL